MYEVYNEGEKVEEPQAYATVDDAEYSTVDEMVYDNTSPENIRLYSEEVMNTYENTMPKNIDDTVEEEYEPVSNIVDEYESLTARSLYDTKSHTSTEEGMEDKDFYV
eukprot:m.348143 g.348143  ORF g.348143 m.348143 type:complete len:107 (+) comp35679_c0_seq1:842-1162(+)